jgi:hypothetical protein
MTVMDSNDHEVRRLILRKLISRLGGGYSINGYCDESGEGEPGSSAIRDVGAGAGSLTGVHGRILRFAMETSGALDAKGVAHTGPGQRPGIKSGSERECSLARADETNRASPATASPLGI